MLEQPTSQPSSKLKAKGKSNRVYVCPFETCKKCFTESGNLKTHIRTHVLFDVRKEGVYVLLKKIDGRATFRLRICRMQQIIYNESSFEIPLLYTYRREASYLPGLRQKLLQNRSAAYSPTHSCIFFSLSHLHFILSHSCNRPVKSHMSARFRIVGKPLPKKGILQRISELILARNHLSARMQDVKKALPQQVT